MFTLFNALLLAGGALSLYSIYGLFFWIREGFRVMKPGYVAPRPGLVSRLLRLALARLFLFWYVGPVKIIGAKNLEYFGRVVALGAHKTERDTLVTMFLMGSRPVRYFIASNQAGGIRAPIVAFTGGIVVHPSPAAAAAALLGAIRAMQREDDASFPIFPQGELKGDKELMRRDFKPGAAKLAIMTAAKSPTPVAYLPFGMFYDRDPAHATKFHHFMRDTLGIKSFRRFFADSTSRGVLAIGAPIPVKLMPDEPETAMDALFEQICVQNDVAERAGAEWPAP